MTRAWLLNCGFALGLLPGVALAQADSDTSRSPTTGAPGEIVVTARLEKTARNHERIAPNLINIQSAESIAKYPDYNAAEALSRIPGVSLSIDTGEGRFVNIRGIDGNLNGATFGGTPLLNTNAGGTSFTGAGRAVEFDTIPTGAIDQILVTKTLTPDHDAEGIGGSVDLSPRSAIGRQGFYVQGQLGEGYEPERKTTNLNEEFVVGDSFGHNANGGPLVHIVLTQNEHNDGRGFDDIEVGGYLDDPTVLVGAANQDKVVTDYQLRRYRYHRQRFGYSAGIEVTPDDDTRFFVRVNEAGYQEEVVKKRLQIEGLDGSGGTITVDPANPKGFAVTGADAVIRSTDEKETHRNFVTQIGGERRFGEIKVDWIGAYERATFFSPYNYGTKWDGPQGLNLTYDNVTDPNYPRINVAGVNLADPTLYNLVSVSNSQEYTADREWSYGLNVSAPLHLTHDDELKVGGLLRYRRKYDETSSSDGANAIPAGVLLSNYEGDAGAITNFYNGRYNIGYDVNTAGVERDFPTTPLTPLTKRSTGTLLFDDTENILAGYGQYSGNIEKLHFLIGVRVERTKTIYDSPTSLPPANQAIPGRYLTTTTDVNGNYLFESRNSYTNAFPSLQLRYEIQPNFIARAAYSTSISRPGFNLTTLNPNVVAPATAGGNGTISVGNPSLKPVYSHNFDLSVAYYRAWRIL